jgi:hypothetical protein
MKVCAGMPTGEWLADKSEGDGQGVTLEDLTGIPGRIPVYRLLCIMMFRCNHHIERG